jgi:glutamate-1-semialdehyde aminotransferase
VAGDPRRPDFLERLCRVTRKLGMLLTLDEVISPGWRRTGRVGPGRDPRPDHVGKIIGGRREVMELPDP